MKVDLEYFRDNFFSRYGEKRLPVSFTEKRHLKSCDRCQGTGRTSREELTDYHKREYDTFHEDCKNCNGQGRVIVTEIFVSFGDIPYSPKVKSSSFSRILYETFEEPYTIEGAENIERQTKFKSFSFSFEDVKET